MRILVIRFSSAGDIILTSLFMRALRRRFPEAEVHFMTKREFESLVQYSPYVDQLITIEPGTKLRHLLKLKSDLIRDNGGDYDIVFDLHNSLRSRYVRAGMGKEMEAFEKPTWKKWLLVKRKINRLRPIVPIAERYLEVGARFGVVNDGEGIELFTGNALAPIVAAPGRPTIAIAPGAKHATKRWPAERFAELASELARQHNARIVLFGGRDERELCMEIASRVAGDVVNLAGRASLLEAAAAVDVCDVVVANDSAMAHVAAARKRPVIAIFGSTVQEFGFAPYGTRSEVIEVPGLYCRPCTTIGRESCPEGHFRCMKEIEVGAVMESVVRMMEGR